MSSRNSRLLLVLMIAANAGAVLLFSGVGPMPQVPLPNGAHNWHPFLAFVADLLTLPIPAAGISEVRDVILPAAAGLALLLMAGMTLSSDLRWRSGGSSAEHDGPQSGPYSRPGGSNKSEGASRAIIQYLCAAAAAVVVIAVLSTVVNESLDLSWGWIVRFAAGATWAIVIASMFGVEPARKGLIGLLAIGLACLLLSIAHRADRGLAHFTWPIGPITSTAALASVWAAMSASALAVMAFYRRWSVATLLCVVVLCLSIYVLRETGRRAPALGLAAALLVSGAVLVLHEFRNRYARIMLAASVLLAVIGSGAYVALQFRSRVQTASGPIALRIELWRRSAGLIGDNPSLGYGPDTFVVEMTNALAPNRARSPHFYHGDVDQYAHNEWIQTAVELGIPGALFYLAIPLGLLWMAHRRFEHPLDMPFDTAEGGRATSNVNHARAVLARRRSSLLALIGGLVAVVVTESGSITLRTPIMPMWYWTIIGLLASCCRREAAGGEVAVRPRGIPRALLCFAAAVLFLAAAAVDLANSMIPEMRYAGSPVLGGVRLFPEKTLVAYASQAERDTAELAYRQGDPWQADQAVKAWRRVYERIAGWIDVPAQYAAALLAASHTEQARHVLSEAISPRLNPYEPCANILYAQHATDDPAEKFRCIQRALRQSRLTEPMRLLLSRVAVEASCQEILRDELPAALTAAENRTPPAPDDMDIELLRLHAFLLFEEGQYGAAIADQRLACRYTAHLEVINNLYRRAADAESDAFYTLAWMIYRAQPVNFRESFQAIRHAEYYAVLGIAHEQVADPEPELGFIGGVVVPTEFPVRLFPLWKLSALLQVIAGDEALLDARILSYLRDASHGAGALEVEKWRLRCEAYEFLRVLPPSARPAHFDRLKRECDECAERSKTWNPRNLSHD